MTVQKFVRFQSSQGTSYGILEGGEILALDGDLFGAYQKNGKVFKLDEVKLLAPCEPSKAVCIGLNYKKHAAELSMTLPEEPLMFIKPNTSIIGPYDEVVYWPEISRLDYEAELVIVIGKKAFRIEPHEAEDYIFGYTVGNDVTARDLQMKDGQWTRGKGFDTFLPLGPAIVKGIDISDLKIQATLNGEIKQESRTSDLIFSVAKLVSYVSKVMTLLPGDIIMTGTPEGVGPMQVGDTIIVNIDNIGSISNKIINPSL